MVHATALRFTAATRFTLRSGETVRPLEDRFGGEEAYDETPACFVIWACSVTSYGAKGTPAGELIWRVIALDQIEQIDGAMTTDQQILAADSVTDVEADVRCELFGGRAK